MVLLVVDEGYDVLLPINLATGSQLSLAGYRREHLTSGRLSKLTFAHIDIIGMEHALASLFDARIRACDNLSSKEDRL